MSAATVLPSSSATVSGSNANATKQSGEPNHAGEAGGKSVWWKFTAPTNGTLVISTSGSSFDTLLGVYTGSVVSSLTTVTSNDQYNGNTSQVSFSAIAGTVYLIAVDGYGAGSGSITLSTTWTSSASVPGNDGMSAATVLPSSSATVSGSNANATKQSGEPNHAGEAGGKSVWWKFTAPTNGTLVISTSGSSFDTLLGVYTGSVVSSLTTVTSNDDFGGMTSEVSFSAIAGTVYLIAVDGYSGSQGEVTLSIEWTHLFGSASPVRVFDTRPGQSAFRNVAPAKVGGGYELRVKVTDVPGVVPASGVGAVSLNVTVTEPDGAGYVTVYPCDERPLASNLNFSAGQTVPNAVIAGVSGAGEVCFYSSVPTHIIADVGGWFASNA
jgi:hypothetical protein